MKNSVVLTFLTAEIAIIGALNYSFSETVNIEKTYSDMSESSCVGICQWTRVSSTQLRFEGVIKPGSESEFKEKVNEDVREIILNSGGGSVRVALEIAKEIERRNLNVTVNDFCISSCANYLFLAGKVKRINGLVGFHGSVGALNDYNCTKKQSDTACKIMLDEQYFFKRTGISNKLFDITQSDSKGMDDGHVYAYYAPSSQVLHDLGVRNIVGEQNKLLLGELNKKFEKTGNIVYRVATDPNPAILKVINGKE